MKRILILSLISSIILFLTIFSNCLAGDEPLPSANNTTTTNDSNDNSGVEPTNLSDDSKLLIGMWKITKKDTERNYEYDIIYEFKSDSIYRKMDTYASPNEETGNFSYNKSKKELTFTNIKGRSFNSDDYFNISEINEGETNTKSFEYLEDSLKNYSDIYTKYTGTYPTTKEDIDSTEVIIKITNASDIKDQYIRIIGQSSNVLCAGAIGKIKSDGTCTIKVYIKNCYLFKDVNTKIFIFNLTNSVFEEFMDQYYVGIAYKDDASNPQVSITKNNTVSLKIDKIYKAG